MFATNRVMGKRGKGKRGNGEEGNREIGEEGKRGRGEEAASRFPFYPLNIHGKPFSIAHKLLVGIVTWNQSQYLFERVGNQWTCRISLPPGKYQYKFIVDGNWLIDPSNPAVVRDQRGIEN